MAILSNLKHAVTPDTSDNGNKPTTVDQSTLKILVGLLGIFLPFILWFGLLAFKDHPSNGAPVESISHYYYTRMSSWFVVTLSLLAVILIFYKGKTFEDVWLSTAAGIFALIVVLLPTTNLSEQCNDEDFLYAVTYIADTPTTYIRTKVHYFSAALFLFCLAVISFWRFPKTDTSPGFKKNKKFYTGVYKACGVIMVVSMVAILLGNYGILLKKEWFERESGGYGTFVGEAIAVVAFGYSWLLNAGFFTKIMKFVFADYYPEGTASAKSKS